MSISSALEKKKIEDEIDKVSNLIEDVDRAIQAHSGAHDERLAYFYKEKEQLRKDKEQLRAQLLLVQGALLSGNISKSHYIY